jgi:hypothetical protein
MAGAVADGITVRACITMTLVKQVMSTRHLRSLIIAVVLSYYYCFML